MNWFQRAGLAINGDAMRFIESAKAELATLREIKESVNDLELDMRDQGWQLLVQRSRTEFSRAGMDLIIEASRLFAIKNPIIGRGCRISSYYVFGRGVDIRSDDEAANAILQEFWTNPDNRSELSQAALYESNNEQLQSGNIFYVLFTDRIKAKVRIRSVDALEIRDIVTDPEDSSVPRYYKRTFSQDNFDVATGITNPSLVTRWYPAVGWYPDAKPATIAGDEVMWDSPIIHHKTGGLKKWRFGLSRVYPAIDWTTAYRKLLADYCKKAENLARFGYKIKTKGGQKSVDATKTTLESTAYTTTSNPRERNPAPQTGAAAILGEGFTMDALRTAGANTDPEEGRRVAHMAYMCFDFDERYFGDVSVGSLATGTSMDRPTELACRSQQESWEDIFTQVSRYVLSVASRAAASDAGKALREAKTDPAKVNVNVSFPGIIEQDPDKAIAGLVKLYTAGASDGKCGGLIDPKTAAAAAANVMGVDDAQAHADKMYPDEDYDAQDFAATPAAEEPQVDPAANVPGSAGPPKRRSSPNQPGA